MRLAVCPLPLTDDPAPHVAETLYRAAAANADLAILPELAVCGSLAAAALPGVAQASDGPAALALAARAKATGLAVLAGHPEACSGRVYSSCLLVDAGGHALANYRRTHLRPEELKVLGQGQWLSGVHHQGRQLGIMAGYDLYFPEVARSLVLAGIDLLLVSAGPLDDPEAMRVLAAARALENGVVVAVAGWGPGAGCIAFADGLLRRPDDDDLPLVTDLPPPNSPSELLAQRRPRLYQRVVVDDASDSPRPA